MPGSAEFVSVEHPFAISVDDSSVEVLVEHDVDSTATGKRDLEDGIVAVRTSSSATAGDGNRSRLLGVIESVFPCLVTRFANSPNSSLRVSSHARARALCFAAASAILSDTHSALHALPALIDAHADDSLMHGALDSGVLSWKGRTGTRRVKGGVSGPAEDVRPVAEVGTGVNFRPAGGVRGQVAGSLPRRQPGTGTRWHRVGVVTPSLHPEVPDTRFTSPGRGFGIRQPMGCTKVCQTRTVGDLGVKG